MAEGTTAIGGAECREIGMTALGAFEHMIDGFRAMAEALRELKPALEALQWEMMTPAQRRRWCKRLIRNWKPR